MHISSLKKKWLKWNGKMENDAEFMTYNIKCNKYEIKMVLHSSHDAEEGHWNADYTITRNSTLKDYVIEFHSQTKQNLILCVH